MRENERKNGREKCNIRPRYMVWENVPGAFSSGKGEDFRIVLEETARIADGNAIIPRPPKNKWSNAGCIMGNGWSIAWRVHDAQFWGVPQRRRRIALVADFGGQSAPEILFESEGLSGYSAESFRAWQGTARRIENGADKAGVGFDGYNGCLTEDKAATLGINCGMSTGRNGVVLNDQGGDRMDVTHDVTSTLRAGVVPATVYENHSQDTRYTDTGDVAPTVLSTYGTGGNNQPFVDGVPRIHKSVVPTLNTSQGGQRQPCIAQSPTYCVRRLTPLECNRLQGYPDYYTQIPGWKNVSQEEVAKWTDIFYEWDKLKSKTPEKVKRKSEKYIRKWLANPTSDSAEYKALGNSIALPFWRWMLKRIASYFPQGATMGSLFDGIGGFPLIWESINGCGSCLWASEIEPFCIAVTKTRIN